MQYIHVVTLTKVFAIGAIYSRSNFMLLKRYIHVVTLTKVFAFLWGKYIHVVTLTKVFAIEAIYSRCNFNKGICYSVKRHIYVVTLSNEYAILTLENHCTRKAQSSRGGFRRQDFKLCAR